jgi:hypothetical protein
MRTVSANNRRSQDLLIPLDWIVPQSVWNMYAILRQNRGFSLRLIHVIRKSHNLQSSTNLLMARCLESFALPAGSQCRDNCCLRNSG